MLRGVASGGGSGLTVGGAVTGGGANRVLYEDASQNLATTSGFTFVSGTGLSLPTGNQFIAPATLGAAGYTFAGNTGTGYGWRVANTLSLIINTSENYRADASYFYALGTGFHAGANVVGFAASSAATVDAALSRTAAGEVSVGTGAAGSAAGTMRAAAYKVGATAGASFGPGAVASITVVNGIVTAIS